MLSGFPHKKTKWNTDIWNLKVIDMIVYFLITNPKTVWMRQLSDPRSISGVFPPTKYKLYRFILTAHISSAPTNPHQRPHIDFAPARCGWCRVLPNCALPSCTVSIHSLYRLLRIFAPTISSVGREFPTRQHTVDISGRGVVAILHTTRLFPYYTIYRVAAAGLSAVLCFCANRTKVNTKYILHI